MNEADDLIREFLIESHEGLDRLDQDLVHLEQVPHDPERLHGIFRVMHTLKGTCGCLGLTTLEQLSHGGENLLSRLRDGDLTLDAEVTTGLLSLVDAIRDVLRHIEHDGTEGPSHHGELMAYLAMLTQRGNSGADAAPADVAVEVVAGAGDRRAGRDRRTAVADTTLRVDVELVDALVSLVDELGLTRDEFLHLSTARTEPGWLAATERLHRVTSHLQRAVMKTRMQRIGTIWSRLPRVVRDVAGSCGKQVRLEMEGMETDLDRTVVEAIKDPITHIIRNAVDHGIEPPVTRLVQGKPAEGVIRLRACQQDGAITIEIADDGGGIDVALVRQRALALGVLTPDQSAALSDQEVVDIVFAPGVSTAAEVTHLSGRGVGLDIVRTNVHGIGGTVGVRSVPCVGTTVRITVPATLGT